MLKQKYQQFETTQYIENLMRLLEDERGNSGMHITTGPTKAISNLSDKLFDRINIDCQKSAREILGRLKKIRDKEPDKLTGQDALVAIDAGNVR